MKVGFGLAVPGGQQVFVAGVPAKRLARKVGTELARRRTEPGLPDARPVKPSDSTNEPNGTCLVTTPSMTSPTPWRARKSCQLIWFTSLRLRPAFRISHNGGGGPLARGGIKLRPGNRSVNGPWPTRPSQADRA